jgi:hypothetical protein
MNNDNNDTVFTMNSNSDSDNNNNNSNSSDNNNSNNNSIITKQFELDYDDIKIIGEVINLNKSVFVNINKNGTPPRLGSLVVGMETRFEPLPLTTTLIAGDTIESELMINTISKRLSKKFHIQAFVSSSLIIQDPIIIEKIIEKIIESIIIIQ